MKYSLFLLSVFLIVFSVGFSQCNISIYCIDSDSDLPIGNIRIENAYKVLGHTDESGRLSAETDSHYLYFSHVSYRDTLIQFSDDTKELRIELKPKSYSVDEITVKGKYKPKKHFKKLIKENRENANRLDSTLFYYFERGTKICGTKDSAFVSGIYSIEFIEYKNRQPLVLQSIIEYCDNIPDTINLRMKTLFSQLHPFSNVLGVVKMKNRVYYYEKSRNAIRFDFYVPENLETYSVFFENSKLKSEKLTSDPLSEHKTLGFRYKGYKREAQFDTITSLCTEMKTSYICIWENDNGCIVESENTNYIKLLDSIPEKDLEISNMYLSYNPKEIYLLSKDSLFVNNNTEELKIDEDSKLYKAMQKRCEKNNQESEGE